MASFYQKAGEHGKVFEDIVFVGGAFQIRFSAAAASANTAANHAMYHVHVPVAPAAQLFIQLQHGIDGLKRQLQQRIAPVAHDEKGCTACPWRKLTGPLFVFRQAHHCIKRSQVTRFCLAQALLQARSVSLPKHAGRGSGFIGQVVEVGPEFGTVKKWNTLQPLVE